MLEFRLDGYDEFRNLFGTRRNGGRLKNKILLDFWKYRFNCEGERPFCDSTSIKSLKALYDLVINYLTKNSPIKEGEYPNEFVIQGYQSIYRFRSFKYKVPSSGCIDFKNYGNICYLDTEHTDRDGNAKLCSMGAGRMIRKIIAEYKLKLPESTITFVSEEFQRAWQSDIETQLNSYKLVVDKSFELIYTRSAIAGDCHSCMVNKGFHEFYNKSVDASAAYLVKDGLIHARCIIFHNVVDEQGNKHNLIERQYSGDTNSEQTKAIFVNMLIQNGYGDLFKKVGAGASDAQAIVDVKTDKLMANPNLGIPCNIDVGGKIPYLDTFKYYYPDKHMAYNYVRSGRYYVLTKTDGRLGDLHSN